MRSCFNRVKLNIRLFSDDSPERLEKLKKNVEYRCPVLTLFREADADIQAGGELVSE